jgi:predicted nuclease of predicted toxin-antitoxin system
VRLLFDENLSPRLVGLLSDVYPGCTHVHLLGMDEADDAEIWRFAAAEGFTIATKDADFGQKSFAYGHPPKVIWIRLGNCTVADSANLLRERYILIHHFHESREAALLQLG